MLYPENQTIQFHYQYGRQNVGPDLDPNCLTLKEYFEIKKKKAEDCKNYLGERLALSH